MKKKLSVKLILICLFAFTLLNSCSKDKSKVLIGVWNYTGNDYLGNYNANWTFRDNGTMTINDKNDAFNGQSINYLYNNSTETLTIGGLVNYKLVWQSNTKFTITFNANDITEFNKQ